MNNVRKNILFTLFLGILFLVGCSGGGGSPAPVEKDVAGINATLSGFMASVASNDATAASSYLAQTTSESHVHTLMVYDFGSDIYNPSDERSHYAFTVDSSNIEQPSDSIAIVKAYYKLSSGEPLWITFALIKENGVWTIETITLGHTTTSSLSSFVTSTYFPITKGAVAKYLLYYQGTAETSYKTRTWADTPTVVGGNDYYRLTEQYPNASIRATPIGFGASEIYYSLQSTGLWFYSPTVNSGSPMQILDASYSYGSVINKSFTSTDPYSNTTSSSQSEITIGYPQTYTAPLGSLQAVPVTFITTSNSGTASEYKSKMIMWLAPTYGQVGIEFFRNLTDATSAEQEKISEYTLPPSVITPPPTSYTISNVGALDSANSSYVITYTVDSSAVSITGITATGYSSNLTAGDIWTGKDSATGNWITSVHLVTTGDFSVTVDVQTSDGAVTSKNNLWRYP